MKAKYFEQSSKPGKLICSLTGAEFSYTISDMASRQAAIAKLGSHQSQSLDKLRERRPTLTQAQHFGAPVPHPDPRTDAERRAAAQKQLPKQPSGVAEPGTPFAAQRIAALVSRHGRHFLRTDEGKKRVAEIYAQDKERAAKAQASAQQQSFQESIAPLLAHARSSLDDVRNDPTTTQAEVEQAEERLRLAQSGDVAGYSQADKEWRQVQANKLVSAAVEVDSQVKQLQSQRDALLKAAYEPLSDPAEPVMVDVIYPPGYHDPDKAGRTIKEPMPSIG